MITVADIPLVEVRPYVHDEDHSEEGSPTQKRADTSAQTVAIEQGTHKKRSDNLSHPVHEVVERPRANVEYSAIVLVEFCICIGQGHTMRQWQADIRHV